MTQKEHGETMRKMRKEFMTLWDAELEPQMIFRNVPLTSRIPIMDIAWQAFTHGKIPVVDKD